MCSGNGNSSSGGSGGSGSSGGGSGGIYIRYPTSSRGIRVV